MQLGTQMLKFHTRAAPEYWGLTFTAEEPNVVVNMAKVGNAPAVTLEYSTNGRKWLPFDADSGTTPVTLKRAGSKVFFRAGSGGNTRMASGSIVYRRFTLSGYCAASGSIMSIFDAENESNLSLSTAYAAANLFYDNAKMTSAPELPATTVSDYCYRGMFQNCTSLTSAPELPATTLANYCYYQMFSGCTSLASAPTLPATALVTYCYRNMFDSCTSLTAAPALPATTLVDYCYYGMFNGCTSLTSAPALSSTSLANSCYGYMFSGCTSLTSAPALPATTLANNCYQSMFSGCTSLATAPALAAPTLANHCYESMFSGCTSLAAAPALPATVLGTYCYQGMFQGCTSLVSAPALPALRPTYQCYQQMFKGCTSLTVAPDLPAYYAEQYSYYEMFMGCSSLSRIRVGMIYFPDSSGRVTTNWLSGVAASGVFECFDVLGKNSSISRGASACPSGWTVSNDTSLEPPLTFTAGQSNSIIAMAKSGSPSVTPTMYYKKYNGSSWGSLSTFSPNSTSIILSNAGDKVLMFSEISATASSTSAYWYFVMTGSIAASGSMESIVPGGSAASYTFCYLFKDCTKLTSAPSLPHANFEPYACYRMFSGCTALTTAPALPATTLAEYCYYGMFYGCTSLTSAPAALPATTLADYCYYYMFYGCTSLASAPVLSATTLSGYCYARMFYNCTSLTSAPELPATMLAERCYYQMFLGCTSLAYAPELPATTLEDSCYFSMFNGCTSLASAPALPATTLAASCYRQMFHGCTSLKQTPDLPAMTANALTYVYYRMFYNCTGLERTGRIAIATATGNNAVAQMFYGCSNLKYIELSGMTAWSTRMTNWVNGVSASGLFVCPAALGAESTITRGVSNCPSGWTVANPVEYLQSTGTQYIDTGLSVELVSGQTYRGYQAEIEYKFASYPSGESWVFGYWNNIPSARIYLIGLYQSYLRAGAGPDNSTYWGNITRDNNFHVAKILNDGAYFDGVRRCATDLSQLAVPSSNNIWLFKSPHVDNGGTRQVKYCKMWTLGNALSRDFHPVRINSEGCMLDKANLTGGTNNDGIYHNAGTGSFTLGPDA